MIKLFSVKASAFYGQCIAMIKPKTDSKRITDANDLETQTRIFPYGPTLSSRMKLWDSFNR